MAPGCGRVVPTRLLVIIRGGVWLRDYLAPIAEQSRFDAVPAALAYCMANISVVSFVHTALLDVFANSSSVRDLPAGAPVGGLRFFVLWVYTQFCKDILGGTGCALCFSFLSGVMLIRL